MMYRCHGCGGKRKVVDMANSHSCFGLVYGFCCAKKYLSEGEYDIAVAENRELRIFLPYARKKLAELKKLNS